MARICSKCGNKLLQGQHICDSCGTRASDIEISSTKARKPVKMNTSPVQAQRITSDEFLPPAKRGLKKRASKKAVIAIITCSLLVITISLVLLIQFYDLDTLIYEVFTNGRQQTLA